MKNFYKIIDACIAVAITALGIAVAENFPDFMLGFVTAVWVVSVIVEFTLGDD